MCRTVVFTLYKSRSYACAYIFCLNISKKVSNITVESKYLVYMLYIYCH